MIIFNPLPPKEIQNFAFWQQQPLTAHNKLKNHGLGSSLLDKEPNKHQGRIFIHSSEVVILFLTISPFYLKYPICQFQYFIAIK